MPLFLILDLNLAFIQNCHWIGKFIYPIANILCVATKAGLDVSM